MTRHDLSKTLVLVFTAALAGSALAGGPPGKNDDGNSKRFTERNKITSLEKAYEAEQLDIEYRGSNGTVRIKQDCEGCPAKEFRIVASSKAFLDGKEIPLARVASLDELRGVVMAKPNNSEVIRILAFKK